MFLGALLDIGLPLDGLRAALGSLAIEYGSISAERVLRAGVSATKFRTHAAEYNRAQPGIRHSHGEHGHSHGHEQHGSASSGEAHHSLAAIAGFIERSALSPSTRIEGCESRWSSSNEPTSASR